MPRMCGRFTYLFTWKQLHERMRLTSEPLDLTPRYNVAPTQTAPIIHGRDGERRASMMRWGLVPFWATDMSIGNRMINARSEEASVKPAFRAAFKSRRCIVPVSGFYEWKKLGEGLRKQPYYLRPPGGGIFAFAGLWESWRGGATAVDAELLTFTILTTRASEFVGPIHDRMPVILSDEGAERWLDPSTPPADLQSLFVPAPEGSVEAYAVATRVNSPANDAPDLIEPAAA